MGFLNWTYYFDSSISSTFWGWGYWVLVALLILGILAGLILPGRTKKLPFMQRQVLLRALSTAHAIGWLGLIWLFFRFEGIRYLNWRLWGVLLVFYGLYQIGWMIKFAKVDFPRRRASKITGQEKEKYLKRYLGR